MTTMSIENWKELARGKIREYYKDHNTISFVVEMLSYIRLLHVILRGKVAIDDVKGDICRMMIGLSGAVYELPFFLQVAPRVMPMFQNAILGYLDAAKYVDKLESDKDKMTPDERMKMMERMTSASNLHREFAIAVLGTEGGLAKQSGYSMRLREVVDDLFALE